MSKIKDYFIDHPFKVESPFERCIDCKRQLYVLKSKVKGLCVKCIKKYSQVGTRPGWIYEPREYEIKNA